MDSRWRGATALQDATRPATGQPPDRAPPAASPAAGADSGWDPARSRRQGLGGPHLLAAGVGLAVLAAVLSAPYPPLQDYVEWVYQAEILTRLPAGTGPAGVHLAPYPVPNSLFQLVVGGLTLLLPARLAGTLFLLLYVGAALALAVGLARRYQPQAATAVTGILLVSFCFNTPFWNGYANYQTGLLLFMAWLLLPPARQASPALILVFGLLTFLAHAMSFVAFATLVGLQALPTRWPGWRASRRSWPGLMRARLLVTGLLEPRLLALLPAAGLFAWYVLAKLPPDPSEIGAPSASVSWPAFKAYTVAKLGPYHNFVFETGGDAVLRPWLYWAGAGVNLAYAAGLLGVLGWGLATLARRRAVPAPPVLAALGLGLLFLVLPQRMDVVVNPGERLLYPALLLLLLALPLPRVPLRVLGAGAGLLLLPLGVLALTPGPWWVPVSPAGPPSLATSGQVLFWHRPTAFACKWQELEALAAGQPAAHRPITFRTSLLVGAGGQECDPDWRRRGARR